MPYPITVENREVIIGGGVHAAIYAATRRAIGKPPPIILEREPNPGGVFGRLADFLLNSVDNASVESTAAGPSRVRPVSESDTLNFLPNCRVQVPRTGREYPNAKSVAHAVAESAYTAAEVYTDCNDTLIESDGRMSGNGKFLGTASRVIWAAGLSMKAATRGAVISAESFLAEPGAYRMPGKRVAIVGGGDTAATVAETLVGQGLTLMKGGLPTEIDWYGGTGMPGMTKLEWAANVHARYMALGRHFPQADSDQEIGLRSVIRPVNQYGRMANLGQLARVNDRTYDIAIDATGFKPVRPDFGVRLAQFVNQEGRAIAEWDRGKVFVIGSAMTMVDPRMPYPTKFGASAKAIFALAPLTAELAANMELYGG